VSPCVLQLETRLPVREGSDVAHATRPTALQGRASVSPRVPRLQTRLLVWEGSSVATCPVPLGLPPGRERLRCHHTSYGSRPASQCGRALASPCAPWLSASETCPYVPKVPDIRLIMASPGHRVDNTLNVYKTSHTWRMARIKCVQHIDVAGR
jgi:hypothetical protein